MTSSGVAARRQTVTIHDRDFQRYSIDNRIYCIPVDEEEEDRLVTQHDVIQRMFGGRLFFPSIDNPERVLDCGFGRGSWAVAMADWYEDCQVTGIDIYPADLPEQPDNLELEMYNLNDGLLGYYRPSHYDLIHSRFVGPGIHKNRWRSYVGELNRLLKPGGWLQMVEYYYCFQSDNGLLTEAHALRRWWAAYAYAMAADRDPRASIHLRDLMQSAGFVDVRMMTYNLPIGGWHADPRLRQIGEDNLANVAELLDSQAIWPFRERLHWHQQQFQALTDAARTEAGNLSLKLYLPIYVAWGRRSRS